MKKIRLYYGFSIYEVLIALLVVAVLAVIAVPAYHNYFQRLRYKNNIIQPLAAYQTAVEKCFQAHKSFTGCNAGTRKIPAAITTPKGNIASLTVTNGVITVVPVAGNGVTSSDTYILSPVVGNDEAITWKSSGQATTSGLAD